MGPTSTQPTGPTLPESVRLVREEVGPDSDSVPIASHREWETRFPWLVQGVTCRGPMDSPFDLALAGDRMGDGAWERWAALLAVLDMDRAALGRQVHGSVVRFHREGAVGVSITPGTDGHVTRTRGLLVAVTVADCVPVTIVDPGRRAVAVVHAGWRGTAAGALEAGVEVLAERLGSRPECLHVHLGPAICGSCYEVGPEVHAALALPEPGGSAPVDLRAVLARRALEAGVEGGRMTVSEWCTRCGDSPFFSHRGGDAERQVAFAGLSGRAQAR